MRANSVTNARVARASARRSQDAPSAHEASSRARANEGACPPRRLEPALAAASSLAPLVLARVVVLPASLVGLRELGDEAIERGAVPRGAPADARLSQGAAGGSGARRVRAAARQSSERHRGGREDAPERVRAEAVGDPVEEREGRLTGACERSADAGRERARESVLTRELPGERRVEPRVRRDDLDLVEGDPRRKHAPEHLANLVLLARRAEQRSAGGLRRSRRPSARSRESRAGRRRAPRASAFSTAESSRPRGARYRTSPGRRRPARAASRARRATSARSIHEDAARVSSYRARIRRSSSRLRGSANAFDRKGARGHPRARGAPRGCSGARGGTRAGRAARRSSRPRFRTFAAGLLDERERLRPGEQSEPVAGEVAVDESRGRACGPSRRAGSSRDDPRARGVRRACGRRTGTARRGSSPRAGSRRRPRRARRSAASRRARRRLAGRSARARRRAGGVARFSGHRSTGILIAFERTDRVRPKGYTRHLETGEPTLAAENAGGRLRVRRDVARRPREPDAGNAAVGRLR